MAIAEGAEVFVTGEMKHHEVNAALASGLSVILGGHTATERGYLPRLAAVLAERLPRVKFFVSKEDRDPLVLR
jgi:putative NIF3 family GTP cyclohydrolase 1 type 2